MRTVVRILWLLDIILALAGTAFIFFSACGISNIFWKCVLVAVIALTALLYLKLRDNLLEISTLVGSLIGLVFGFLAWGVFGFFAEGGFLRGGTIGAAVCMLGGTVLGMFAYQHILFPSLRMATSILLSLASIGSGLIASIATQYGRASVGISDTLDMLLNFDVKIQGTVSPSSGLSGIIGGFLFFWVLTSCIFQVVKARVANRNTRS